MCVYQASHPIRACNPFVFFIVHINISIATLSETCLRCIRPEVLFSSSPLVLPGYLT